MATNGHSTSSPNLCEFVLLNNSTVQTTTDSLQGIKGEETNFFPSSEATSMGVLLPSFQVYKTMVLQAKSWWTALQKWVKSLISKACPALGQGNKQLREKTKMSDCYPAVREGLPTSGRERFTMGTVFHGTQLGAAVAPMNRMVQFLWRQKICLASWVSQRTFTNTFLCQEMRFDENRKKLKEFK